MKAAIVNFSNNEERYLKGQRRQEESLRAVGAIGEGAPFDYFSFKSFEEIGAPDHDDVPYAFKPYALKKVAEMGYDILLWMDAPIYAVKPLNHLFASIGAEGMFGRGALLFENIGFSIGDYTSDACLQALGVTREQSFEHPMIMACCMGFDLRNKEARSLLFDHYIRIAEEQSEAFRGDWNNNNGQVSADSRVKGHRHDQSVMSIGAARHNIKPLIGHQTHFTYFDHDGMKPVAPTVSLISHGY